jgi:hypothetical protein
MEKKRKGRGETGRENPLAPLFSLPLVFLSLCISVSAAKSI